MCVVESEAELLLDWGRICRILRSDVDVVIVQQIAHSGEGNNACNNCDRKKDRIVSFGLVPVEFELCLKIGLAAS